MIKYYFIRKIFLLFIINISIFSDDRQQFEEISVLYKNGLYIDVINKGEEFLKKNPKSNNLNIIKLYLGEAYRQNSNFEKAINMFKTLYSSSLKDRAHYETLIVYLKLDKIEEALSELNKIKKEEIIQKANYFLAKEYYNKNMIKISKDYFEKIVKGLSYNYKEAILYLGMISFKEGNFIESISYFENYLIENKEINEDRKDNIIFQISDAYFKLSMYEESLKESIKIINKNNSIAKRNALIICLKIFNINKDITNFNKYLDISLKQLIAANKIEDLKAIAFMLSEIGYNQKAIEVYKVIASKGFDVDIELAKLYFNLKLYNEALKICDSRDEHIFFNIKIFCYYSLDNYDKVISFRKSIIDTKEEELINLLGDSYYFSNDFKNSLEIFKNLYHINKLEKYLNKIINSLFMLNDKEINNYFNEYKFKFSENVEIEKIMAEYLFKNGKKLESEKILKDLFQNFKDDKILKKLINNLIANGKYDEVIGYSSQFKNSEDKKLFTAIAYMNKHDYIKAVEILKDTNNKYPNNLDVIKNLLDSLYFLEKYNELISLANKNINKKEIQLFLTDRIGMSYSKLGEYNKAIECYEKLYLESTNKDYALVKISEIYYNLKNYSKAIESYKKVLLNFPDSIYAEKCRYHRIVIMNIIKKYDDVITSSELFLKNHKNSSYTKEIFLYLGEAYFYKKDYDKSFKNYNFFLNLIEDENRKQNSLTTLALKFKDVCCYDYSKKLALKILDSKERNIIIAGILDSLGKNEEALSIYKKLFDEGNDDVAFFIANDLFRKKNFEEAKQLYRKCININKNRNEALINLSLIYEKEGDFKKAIINLLSIKNIYKGNNLEDVYLALGRNYEKINDCKNAINIYKDFYNSFKASNKKLYVLEKLIELNLKISDKKSAKIYHLEVKKLDENTFKKYNQYFENN